MKPGFEFSENIKYITGMQLGGERRETSPVIFLKIKKCPEFGEKALDSVHAYVKCTIQNVVLRASRRKNSEIFP